MASWRQPAYRWACCCPPPCSSSMSALTGPDFEAVGLALPFLASIGAAGHRAVYVRVPVMESPSFTAIEQSNPVVRRPVVKVIRRRRASPHLGRSAPPSRRRLPLITSCADPRHREAYRSDSSPLHVRSWQAANDLAGQRAVLRLPLSMHSEVERCRQRRRPPQYRLSYFGTARPHQCRAGAVGDRAVAPLSTDIQMAQGGADLGKLRTDSLGARGWLPDRLGHRRGAGATARRRHPKTPARAPESSRYITLLCSPSSVL